MNAVVARRELPPGRRVLVISDIHGNLPFLKGLLAKAGFCGDDLLILLGDLVERGEDSLGTVRFVMDLVRGGNVWVVSGNCDGIAPGFVDRSIPDEFFHFFLGKWKDRAAVVQLARAAGSPISGPEDYPAARAAIAAAFRPELDFLRSFPTIVETPQLVFVHGGIPADDEHMAELDAFSCMKNDSFLLQESRLRRWCIVGHTPVTLYHPAIPSAVPIISPEKKIVSIDGGCVLKRDGQLNALILPPEDRTAFSWVSYDGLTTVTALDLQAPSADSVNIRWGKSAVEVLTPGPEFSRCRHLLTGRELDILTDYLYNQNGVIHCDDSTDYRLAVSPGDSLSVVRRTSRGLLCKKDGVTGWYLGRTAPLPC